MSAGREVETSPLQSFSVHCGYCFSCSAVDEYANFSRAASHRSPWKGTAIVLPPMPKTVPVVMMAYCTRPEPRSISRSSTSPIASSLSPITSVPVRDVTVRKSASAIETVWLRIPVVLGFLLSCLMGVPCRLPGCSSGGVEGWLPGVLFCAHTPVAMPTHASSVNAPLFNPYIMSLLLIEVSFRTSVRPRDVPIPRDRAPVLNMPTVTAMPMNRRETRLIADQPRPISPRQPRAPTRQRPRTRAMIRSGLCTAPSVGQTAHRRPMSPGRTTDVGTSVPPTGAG